MLEHAANLLFLLFTFLVGLRGTGQVSRAAYGAFAIHALTLGLNYGDRGAETYWFVFLAATVLICYTRVKIIDATTRFRLTLCTKLLASSLCLFAVASASLYGGSQPLGLQGLLANPLALLVGLRYSITVFMLVVIGTRLWFAICYRDSKPQVILALGSIDLIDGLILTWGLFGSQTLLALTISHVLLWIPWCLLLTCVGVDTLRDISVHRPRSLEYSFCPAFARCKTTKEMLKEVS